MRPHTTTVATLQQLCDGGKLRDGTGGKKVEKMSVQ
jgi:hypothetical protein